MLRRRGTLVLLAEVYPRGVDATVASVWLPRDLLTLGATGVLTLTTSALTSIPIQTANDSRFRIVIVEWTLWRITSTRHCLPRPPSTRLAQLTRGVLEAANLVFRRA